MELFGKIIAALPERNGVSAKGNQWRSVTYVLETQEQYPKKLAFDVVNDKIDQFGIQVGEIINVSFDIDAREYQGRYFNQVKAWNITRTQPGAQMPPQGGYQQQPQQPLGSVNPQAGMQTVMQSAQNAQGQFPPQQSQQPAQGQAGDGLPF